MLSSTVHLQHALFVLRKHRRDDIKNLQEDRYCLEHGFLLYVCGVEKDCDTKNTRNEHIGEGSKDGRRMITCDKHENVEQEWRQSRAISEGYTARIRMAKVARKINKATGDRQTNPRSSDRCNAVESDYKHCKSTCSAEAECSGTYNYIVSGYELSFRRHYANVYVLVARPCDVAINGTFFPNEESPEEFI